MNLVCLLKHDWQVLNYADAFSLSREYIDELYKDSEVLPEYVNFINCPDHIVFEDKVCLRCKEKNMSYTRIKTRLPELYEKYLVAIKLNKKRVEERHEELNRREQLRMEQAKKILEEDLTNQ